MAAKSIELDGISKTFYHSERGAVHAVQDLSLTIQAGELITLLGPSGCGKTTALRMVAGFENPTSGRILIGDRDITSLLPYKRNIGFVFQNYALFPHMTVFDNVVYGLQGRGISSEECRARVLNVLKTVGLEGLERRHPNQLSGGEQQRVALARVIVIEPEVLLFDEPLSNLDAKRRIQMRSEIRRIQKSLSITSIYVTHDQEEALSLSDRVVVMNQGRVQQVGTPEDIYLHPRTAFVAGFIGKVNMLPGTVESINGDRVLVTSLGRALAVPTPVIPVSAGDKVSVIIRPEAVSLRPANVGEPGILGQITSKTYLGEKTEYDVTVEGIAMKITAFDPGSLYPMEPGDFVHVVLPQDRMGIVAD